MRTIFCHVLSSAMLLLFVNNCNAENDLRAKDCERLFWLTPSYEDDGRYLLLELGDPEIKEELVEAFRDAEPASGIDLWLLDGRPPDAGYLIFDLGGKYFCLHVYPYSTKPRTANLAKILKFEPGKISIETSSISTGLMSNVDYRTVLRKIPRPEIFSNFALFEVHSTIAPRNEDDKD